MAFRRPTYDIFVGSLPFDITEKTLSPVFTCFGEIQFIKIYESKKGNGKFAFIKYLCEPDANRACKERNGYNFQGSTLFVKRSDSKSRGKKKLKNVSHGLLDKVDNGFTHEADSDSFVMDYSDKSEAPIHFSAPSQYSVDDACMFNNKARPHGIRSKLCDAPLEPPVPQEKKFVHPVYQEKTFVPTMPIDKRFIPAPNTPSAMLSMPPAQDFVKDYVKEYIKLLVTSIEDPITVWAHAIDDNRIQLLININEKTASYCPKAAHISDPPFTQKVYAAIFDDDEQWYRCKVLESTSDNCSLIRYIDFGNTQIIENSKLVELPATISAYEPQAKRYRLMKVKPPHKSSERALYEKAMNYLISNITDKMIEGHILVKYKSDPADYILLDASIQNVNLAQDMVQKGFLKSLTGPSGNGRENNIDDNNSQITWNFLDQQNGAKNLESSMDKNENIFGKIDNWKSFNKNPRMPATSSVKVNPKAASYSPRFQTPPPPTPSTITIDFLKQKRDLQLVTLDRDSKTRQLQDVREKIALMQREAIKTQDQLQPDVITKLKFVLANFAKCKQIRYIFPTDLLIEDPLSKAIRLMLKSEDFILCENFESLSRISISMNEYKASQAAIFTCQDKAQLHDLISRRDEIRIILCQQLEKYLEISEQMPLQQHLQPIQQSLEELVGTFGNYLNLNILSPKADDEVLKLYRALKLSRPGFYREVRKITDACHSILMSSLDKLKQSLSFEVSCHSYEDMLNFDLSKAILELNIALDQEVDVTNLRDSQETEVVTQTVQLLHKKMNVLNKQLHILLSKEKEFQDKINDLKPWLQIKPDLNEIKNIRSSIRNLKSKLRHKLADKRDLEEADNTTAQELNVVIKELKNIRKKLHLAIISEDSVLFNLAQLQDEHFPELNYDLPELSKISAYSGLLRFGRDLDQFELETFPNSSRPHKQLWKTTFNESECLLKEYTLSISPVNNLKEEFLRRALEYYKVVHSNLQTLDAVFFSNNDRTAHVQLKFIDFNVGTVIEKQQNITEKNWQPIFVGILQGLQCLHSAGLVHGALHPSNVLVNENGQGILSEYDFTKTPEERLHGTSTLEIPLMFSGASKLKNNNQANEAFDIFMFGLFVLWIHSPTVAVKFSSEGVSNLNELNISPDILTVVQSCLQTNPELYPSATELLHYPYFSVIEELSETECAELSAIEKSNKTEVSESSVIEESNKTDFSESSIIDESNKTDFSESSVIDESSEAECAESSVIGKPNKTEFAESSVIEESNKTKFSESSVIQESNRTEFDETFIVEESNKIEFAQLSPMQKYLNDLLKEEIEKIEINTHNPNMGKSSLELQYDNQLSEGQRSCQMICSTEIVDTINSISSDSSSPLKNGAFQPPQNTPENSDSCSHATDFDLLHEALQTVTFNSVSNFLQAEAIHISSSTENDEVICFDNTKDIETDKLIHDKPEIPLACDIILENGSSSNS